MYTKKRFYNVNSWGGINQKSYDNIMIILKVGVILVKMSYYQNNFLFWHLKNRSY